MRKSNVSSEVVFTFLGLVGTKVVFSLNFNRNLIFKEGRSFYPTIKVDSKFPLDGEMVKLENGKIYVEKETGLLMTQSAVNGLSIKMKPDGWKFQKKLSVIHTDEIHIDVSKEA